MCASAWIFERFSQAVSWWCPLDSALYSFDRGTVVRKKNQVEHRLHGCMNFCANRGLTCKMYGESSKNRFCTSFQYDLQSAHLHEFSNGFRRQSAGAVLYKVHSQLGQMYSTSEEKSELQKFWSENQPCIENSNKRADYSRISAIFHARMHQIRKSETNLLFTQGITQNALSKNHDNH